MGFRNRKKRVKAKKLIILGIILVFQHRSGRGCCSRINYPQRPQPLDVSGWRSINLTDNLSVTANFFRSQKGGKKKPAWWGGAMSEKI